LLRRFTSKVILSFDPDAAGQGAAARSCELLVAEGFEVNVAVLPEGEDPDGFVQKRGRDAYLDLLKELAALPGVSAGPRRRAHDLTTTRAAPVSDRHAGRGGANSRSGGSRPIR
jgi:DNA primase